MDEPNDELTAEDYDAKASEMLRWEDRYARFRAIVPDVQLIDELGAPADDVYRFIARRMRYCKRMHHEYTARAAALRAATDDEDRKRLSKGWLDIPADQRGPVHDAAQIPPTTPGSWLDRLERGEVAPEDPQSDEDSSTGSWLRDAGIEV